ncbi:MAG TPA: hypothetical protein DEO43_06025 [Halieaceae bacterium]|nr:hypothetical protein [Halieaceae bacterium]
MTHPNPRMQQAGNTNLAAMLNIVADRWVILLLRELYLGAKSWSQFVDVLDISPAILNKRLKLLIETGCLKKESVAGKRETRYLLTQAGKDLYPFMAAAREWQIRWDKRKGAFVSPLMHNCGAPLRTYSACGACHKTLKAQEIRFSADDPIIPDSKDSRHFRLSSTAGADRRSPGAKVGKFIQVMGDRRATLIISALGRGALKFDDISKATGLHPAIITERLRKLQLLGLCQQRLYQERPDRFVYSLTASAQDLFETATHLRQWAEQWLKDTHDTNPGTHLLCDQPLKAQLRCQSCHNEVDFDSIYAAT